MLPATAAIVLVVATLAAPACDAAMTFYPQWKDHLNRMNHKNEKFHQRMIEEDKNWGGNGYPIFLFIGGDGPIEHYYEMAGYVHELAKEFKAMEVFVEHRFYGESLPLGTASTMGKNIGLLTIEQALADVAFVGFQFLEYRATKSKIIVFGGGQYSGLLSFYARMKYPDIFSGAIISSAPIYLEDPSFKRDFFYAAVTESFKNHSASCENAVRQAFASAAGKQKQLKQDLRLCQDVLSNEDFTQVMYWARDLFVKASVYNYDEPSTYPYDLPAKPVETVCESVLSEKDPLVGLGNALGVMYNRTGDKQCFSPWDEFTICSDGNGCGTGAHVKPWFYQNCIENRSPAGSTGRTDMFTRLVNDWFFRKDICLEHFNISPIENWIAIEFLGKQVGPVSNVVFYNGDQDPWLKAGVTQSITEIAIAVVAKDGKHMQDLRTPSKSDSPGVLKARSEEKRMISYILKYGY